MQLDLKIVGWGPASRPTARRIELFADWIETEALLAGEGNAISKPDLVDRLEGTSLIKDNDDGWSLVNDAFATCRQRRKLIGSAYPFSIAGTSIELTHSDKLAYIFCLLISLPEQLQELRTTFPKQFRDIFELLVAQALIESMPGWDIYTTGWSSIADEVGKGAIVEKVSKWVLAKHFDLSVFPNANDAQVDIAAVRDFGDSRGAFPVILGQCATGITDWKNKACRPNLDRWRSAVQFSSQPTKLFAVPFSLDGESFWEATVECSGLVLDRTRICMRLITLPHELQQSISSWIALARPIIPISA